MRSWAHDQERIPETALAPTGRFFKAQGQDGGGGQKEQRTGLGRGEWLYTWELGEAREKGGFQKNFHMLKTTYKTLKAIVKVKVAFPL